MHRHFPPLNHVWACRFREAGETLARYGTTATSDLDNNSTCVMNQSISVAALPSVVSQNVLTSLPPVLLPTPSVHRHPQLTSMTFDIFAKRPIRPLHTLRDLRREVIVQLVVFTLQSRFVAILFLSLFLPPQGPQPSLLSILTGSLL